MSEWKKCTLIDVIELIGGGTPKTSNPEYWNGSIPWLSVRDFNNERRYVYKTEKSITEAGLEHSSTKLLQKDDIIISARGTVGEMAMIPFPMAFNQSCYGIRGKNGIDQTFLYYLIKGSVKRLKAITHGSVFDTITKDTFANITVFVPSMVMQRKIAEILSQIDGKIEINQKINDNLYEMVNAYYTLLFKDVECGMTTIGSYAERIYSGGTPATSNAAYWDGSFGWFSSGETRNRFVISTEKTITQAGIDNSSTKLAAKHDIVMASAGQGFTRGQTSMLLIDTFVNQSVIVIHAERNILPYLFWNLANRYEELRAISDSSSIRGSLTTKMIAAFEIPLANEGALQAFANFSWSIIPQIENNLLENERLAASRDSLLPKLMSGEIDVSDIPL